MNMTEFVRVRQFDSEKGGWLILSGRLSIFCIVSAANPEYFEEHFIQLKETNIHGKGGGSL